MRVDVGQEVQAEATVGEMGEGFAGQARTQVGTADADVHDVADRGVRTPARDEGGHARAHRTRLGRSGARYRRIQRTIAQGRMQCRPALGRVYHLATQQRADRQRESERIGAGFQQRERRDVDTLARQVDRERSNHVLQPGTARAVGEQRAQFRCHKPFRGLGERARRSRRAHAACCGME